MVQSSATVGNDKLCLSVSVYVSYLSNFRSTSVVSDDIFTLEKDDRHNKVVQVKAGDCLGSQLSSNTLTLNIKRICPKPSLT